MFIYLFGSPPPPPSGGDISSILVELAVQAGTSNSIVVNSITSGSTIFESVIQSGANTDIVEIFTPVIAQSGGHNATLLKFIYTQPPNFYVDIIMIALGRYQNTDMAALMDILLQMPL